MNSWLGRMLMLLAMGTIPTLAAAQDEGDAQTRLNLSSDEPIQIESDRFEVDENQSIGIFIGNVSVVQGTTLLKTARMTVHYDNQNGSATTGSAQIERLDAEGGVYLKSEGQVATGDRGTFDMNTEVLVLTGKEVVLTEGENVIVGCKLTVAMKSGHATLESCQDSESAGRVRMLLTPQSQDQ